MAFFILPLLSARNLDIGPRDDPEIQLPVNCQIGRQRWHPVTQQTMPDFYKFPMNKFIDEMNNNNITKKKTKSDLKMLSEWYSTSVIYICWILKCNIYYENAHIKVVFDIVLQLNFGGQCGFLKANIDIGPGG
jgi:hypothetical protein